MIRVGIPRALLYYYYYPMWKTFLSELGAKIEVSGRTTRAILDQGVKSAVDEACLPIKVAFGHVANLAKKVDYLFLPRLVSVANREYICPKFLGFPDMVKRNLKDLPPVIDVTVNIRRRNRDILSAVWAAGKIFTSNPLKIWLAYRRGLESLKIYRSFLEAGIFPEKAIRATEHVVNGRLKAGAREDAIDDAVGNILTIGGSNSAAAKQIGNKVAAGNNSCRKDVGKFTVAVIGHPYNVYDNYINMNIIGKLRKMGARVVIADQIPEEVIFENTDWLPKKLFWTLGQRITGAAKYYLEKDCVDGLVHISAFGCGPDSMIGELIERYSRRQGKVPFLNLTLDEHTGEAGLVTRLEAFLDMVRWRRKVS